MLSRKALLIPAVASVGLLALLGLTGWGGSDDTASPPPSSAAPRATTEPVSIVPTVAAIVVKTTTTTTPPPPPPVTTTTEAEPPPPEVTVPTVPTSSEVPDRGLIVAEGAPCRPEGAIGVSPRGKPLVCREGDNGKLRWTAA